ncbi:MAG: hypothetical protein IJ916_10655 [Paludibacteraceae bacterium]|nr:hypothetical protein [Paludibacteraceae bacterium]
MVRKILSSIVMLASCMALSAAKSDVCYMRIMSIDKTIDTYNVDDVKNVEFVDDTVTVTHGYVDLGLPSGTLWATCNVGANDPMEYGHYFSWGEITGKELYSYDNYKWAEKDTSLPVFYMQYSQDTFQFDDVYNNDTVTAVNLLPEHDVANVRWGGKWRMPTAEDFGELFEYGTFEWTRITEDEDWPRIIRHDLVKYTSRNGKSLILPAAGCDGPGNTYREGVCVIWTSTMSKKGVYVFSGYNGRAVGVPYDPLGFHRGLPVRPVCSGGDELQDSTYTLVKKFLCITLSDGSVVRYNVEDVIKVFYRPETYNREYVDLGLPSGTLWAKCNIGAANPEDAGLLYAWGETETKDSFHELNYKLTDKNKYRDSLKTLIPEEDAAFVNLGDEWRLPTRDEFTELKNNCKMSFEYLNDVYGVRFTAENGEWIFLPATAYKDIQKSELEFFYWSSTPRFYPYFGASAFNFTENEYYNGRDAGIIISVKEGYTGASVRAVRRK